MAARIWQDVELYPKKVYMLAATKWSWVGALGAKIEIDLMPNHRRRRALTSIASFERGSWLGHPGPILDQDLQGRAVVCRRTKDQTLDVAGWRRGKDGACHDVSDRSLMLALECFSRVELGHQGVR